ncbi:cellulose binding domain-containing protein, partial [Micromonospora echinofusca]
TSPCSHRPTSTPPPAGGCTATYRVTNSWAGGFQGEVSVRNNHGASIAGWSVTWTFPNGQQITQLWNGTYTQAGATVTVRDAGWNGPLAPAATTTFGFLASGTGTNSAPAILSCTTR